MTPEGEKLVGIDPEQLRQQLRRETDAKATKQLIVALLYDAGFSPYQIEEILGLPAQTGYNWLDVVAERDPTALGDAPRPGRSPRLSPDQWTELYSNPPYTAYRRRLHRPSLAVSTRSPSHPKRLRHRVFPGKQLSNHAQGQLSVQKSRPRHYKADPAEQQRWREELKKWPTLKAAGYRIVAID